MPLPRTRLAVGVALWVGFLVFARPGPFATAWAHALLLLGPLVLVPLGLELAWGRTGERPSRIESRLAGAVRALQLPAAALLGGAYLVEAGGLAAGLVLPWLLVAGLTALDGTLRALGRFRRHRFPAVADVCVDAGLVFLAVGAAWALADRAGVRPLDFSPVIVLLTAVHFHYAGFALPIMTGLAARRLPGAAARLAAAGILGGVPLVAVGITTSQLGLSPVIESLAALFLAGAAVLSAWLHVLLTAEPDAPAAARVLWGVAAVSLVFGMVLAAFYGARFYLEVPWLDIPWMRALHGTANALGFGLAGLAGWALAVSRSGARRRLRGDLP
ncbi:MAG: YndJ family transporter [Acidobacteriota bacterium]|jgi:hypothetical protein